MVRIPRHLIIAASSWLSKIIIAGVQLVSVKFLLEILGEESYAVFTLLTGLLVWFSIADIGIGSSLQNYISELKADRKSYDAYIKAAVHILFASLIILSSTLFFLSDKLSSLYLTSFITFIILIFSSLSIIVLQTDYIVIICCRYYKIYCNDENIWFNVFYLYCGITSIMASMC